MARIPGVIIDGVNISHLVRSYEVFGMADGLTQWRLEGFFTADCWMDETGLHLNTRPQDRRDSPERGLVIADDDNIPCGDGR